MATVLKSKVTDSNSAEYSKFLKRQRSAHNKLLLETIRNAGEAGITAELLQQTVHDQLTAAGNAEDTKRYESGLGEDSPKKWVEWIGSYGSYATNGCAAKFRTYVTTEGAPVKEPKAKKETALAEAQPAAEVSPEEAVVDQEIASLVEESLQVTEETSA